MPQAKFIFDLSTQMICGKVLFNIKCLLRFCESARENKKLALTQLPAQLRLEILFKQHLYSSTTVSKDVPEGTLYTFMNL